ncbi:MAG: hypothetical protein JO314_09800 [Acidobacteria bacterium]|nr:hypothetical protein [Acidobacteriota bacterium]
MTKYLFVALTVCIASQAAFAQTTTPTPDIATQISQLQDQITLLQKQKDFEKAQMDIQDQRILALANAAKSTIAAPQNKTTVNPAETPSAEVSALSYEALTQLSDQIVKQIHPAISRYSAIVIYNRDDFLNLAKYRLYIYQTDLALKEYNEWKADLDKIVKPIDCSLKEYANDPRCKDPGRAMENNLPFAAGTRSGFVPGLEGFLAAPGIAKEFTGSIAELLAMFRSETIITPSLNTVQESALSTAMGSALIANANAAGKEVLIFVPASFTPEYDLRSEGDNSILTRVSTINQDYAFLDMFVTKTKDLTPEQKARYHTLIDRAESLKDAFHGLAIGNEKIGGQPRTVTAAPNHGGGDGTGDDDGGQYSDFRSLIRAEKLDRFLKQGSDGIGDPRAPKVGILKVHLLSSGGSRRETRNLILGNKMRYSGALTFEVQMFDVDGPLRSSDIFSGYTGFKKFEPLKP